MEASLYIFHLPSYIRNCTTVIIKCTFMYIRTYVCDVIGGMYTQCICHASSKCES